MSDYMNLLLDETRRFFHAIVEAQDESLWRAGLTPIERRLLEALARERSLVAVPELARRTLTTVADIALALQALDDRGWLERASRGEGQRGAESVGLSDEGRAAWRALQANEQQLLARLAAALDEQSARSTWTTLRQLRRTLQRSTVSDTMLAFGDRAPAGLMHCASLHSRPASLTNYGSARAAAQAR